MNSQSSVLFVQCVRVFAAALAILLLFSTLVAAQKRRLRKPARRSVTLGSRIDYSQFSHSTPKHQAACSSCHNAPTENWRKVRTFPDVADFPGHAACVSCHRPQFFRTAKPVICSVCHTKVSPRDDVRFSFSKPNAPRQFVIEFPHDRHQDVIAQALKQLESQSTRFIRTAFIAPADDKTAHYNNCEICHAPRTRAPVSPNGGWPDSFTPEGAFFKTAPSDHSSCFSCHWKSQQPTSANCAGCHKPADQAFLPNDTPLRISLKFRHTREQHVAECTTCHINITKSSTLRGLTPDVPITACSECHNRDGLRLDVSKELDAIDKNKDFVCSYCHTSNVGRRDPPSSHYLIAARPALKRSEIK
jgi:Class III cytochrome C family